MNKLTFEPAATSKAVAKRISLIVKRFAITPFTNRRSKFAHGFL